MATGKVIKKNLNAFYDERIEKADVEEIMARIKQKSELQGKAKHDNYEYCAARLKKGIEVIKHHYSKPGFERVILRLSADESSLLYQAVRPSNKMWAFFRGERKLRFGSDIEGFFYGPHTSTFLR